jgi:polyhydroxyalkanoate synthesis regulator phasin
MDTKEQPTDDQIIEALKRSEKEAAQEQPSKQPEEVREVEHYAHSMDALAEERLTEISTLTARVSELEKQGEGLAACLQKLEKLGTCWQGQGVLGSQMFIMGTAIASPCREALAAYRGGKP